MDDDNKKRQIPQKSVLTIRFLVGAYLLYTDYSLIEGAMSREGGERIVIIAFMILFLVAGGFLMINSGKLLWDDWKNERAELRAQEEEAKQEKAAVRQRSIAENAAIIGQGASETEELAADQNESAKETEA